MMVSDKPWGSFSEADYSEEQWARACIVDMGGDVEGKQRYKLPVREPDGALNRNGVHAAVGGHGLGAVQGISPEQRATAARKLVSLYRNDLNEDPPEGLLRMAGMMTSTNRDEDELARGPIEFRSANVDNVNFANRVITLVAVPYNTPGLVNYRGSLWHEVFERNAFATAEASPQRIRVNRGHDRNRTVGKITQFPRGASESGLVADVKIAKTELGDETLALADEDCLSGSVGYAVLGRGEKLERRTMTRRISKAWLDHLAFVENPTYDDAVVLSVRDDAAVVTEPLPPFVTPNLDSSIEDMCDILRWSSERLNRQ